jgi:DMSO/TMAO reductase YedYZ molybdopterin-dependent catalytic subunit
MNANKRFLLNHQIATRRHFLRLGAAGSAALGLLPLVARAEPGQSQSTDPAQFPEPARAPELAESLAKLESYFTPQEKFQDVSRGNPLPHVLPDDRKQAVGLSRETWRLEVISDPEHPAKLRRALTKADGTALSFADMMQLAEKHAVRFPKVMTCLNIGCPLGMGVWEGVPLREVLWLTRPSDDVRRVFYYGYHNDDPQQMFKSSLPLGRVLEDPFDLPPVILCYKLNGHWLDSQRGGPVRVVVPEAYGFKSIKWLTHIVISNLFYANDTYGEQNNDVDSPLKTFASTLSVPRELKASAPIPVTGYAQVGISGLSRVQVWIASNAEDWPAEDKFFATAPWTDAQILPPPKEWGGDMPDGKLPEGSMGFDPATGQPRTWPMRLGKVHWAALLPGLPSGEYTLRCRTIDEKGIAQPLPRPFRKSGHSAIEAVPVTVSA